MNDGFNYTNITVEGCEGWINLFYKGFIMALIRDVDVAADIKKHTPERIQAKK